MKTDKELDALLKQIAVQVMQIHIEDLTVAELGICRLLTPDYLVFDEENQHWDKVFS